MVITAIRAFIQRHQIQPCGIVVACSGGADSTALLLGMTELRADGFEITCAHVNHHLRGADSDSDEAFVRELAERLRVPFMSADGTLEPEAIRHGGIEAAARQIRHERLDTIRVAAAASLIATAHQKNDQAETIIMRVLTGSGLAGLRGIHPIRADGIIRPLLDVSRSQIDAFLSERGIQPRFDRTNDDPRFLRNRVRAALRAFDAATVNEIAGLADQAQWLWPAFEKLITETETSAVTQTESTTTFHKWAEDPWLRQALLHRHIRRLDPNARDVSSVDLERLAADPDSIRRISVTRTLELAREGPNVVLRHRSDPEEPQSFEIALAADGSAYIPAIQQWIRIRRITADARVTSDKSVQVFSLPDRADPTFTVRNRRPGDRFQPLGMSQDKKLKDFLIDRKIDAAFRDRTPLLIWNDEIVWVGGVEVSERFRVTGSAGAMYEVKLEHGREISETDVQR